MQLPFSLMSQQLDILSMHPFYYVIVYSVYILIIYFLTSGILPWYKPTMTGGQTPADLDLFHIPHTHRLPELPTS
jgi:hypothetical protein